MIIELVLHCRKTKKESRKQDYNQTKQGAAEMDPEREG